MEFTNDARISDLAEHFRHVLDRFDTSFVTFSLGLRGVNCCYSGKYRRQSENLGGFRTSSLVSEEFRLYRLKKHTLTRICTSFLDAIFEIIHTSLVSFYLKQI